ncbi:ABC transporter substrate-binding protein [Consotaella aegiceratis]|uniref:ABC transporter substrate-binding protein n=1 Tax=Consotaella aegiceratis TaxID=3097961 RepID=UPI002F40FC33
MITATAVIAATALVAMAQTGGYPRNETLYSSGTQWGNIVGFNPYVSNYAAGTIGLINETLFRYDPVKDEYIPWLATSGEWTSSNVYKLTIRDGVKWSDGSDFTAEDVKWNIDLGRFPTIWWSNLYDSAESVETDGNTVTVTFKDTPAYQEWQNAVWNMPMVQPAQWKDHATEQEVASWSPEAPIGTGPYVLDENGYDPTTRVVWKKTPDGWWASEAGLIPDPEPNYIIDLVNSSNNVALGLLLAGQEDLNNNFLPGVATLVKGGYGLKTYYDEPPYMLSANTAWLVPNMTKAPTNDVAFRRALAYAINIDQIVQVDYGNLVLPANPTGLLPTWDKYIDQDAVEKYGFSYDPEQAEQILKDAGYTKGADGFYQTPDGKPIDLELIVPSGWSDWMQASQMIAADAKAVGIKITPRSPDFNTYQSHRNTGEYDLVIDNAAQISDTPYTYYRYLYKQPILDAQTNYNFSRVKDDEAWGLVRELNQTPRDDAEKMQELVGQLQTSFMQELPQIPLWYNGIWAQMGTTTWTGWPADGGDQQFIPCMWGGYLQMTGIDTIAHVAPISGQ